MIFKNKSGEVRLVWRTVLLVLPFLLFAYLLRYLPIRILTGVYINRGIVPSIAHSRAWSLFMEDPAWSSIPGILQGLLWYLLVFMMIKWVEKGSPSWKDFGLAAGRKVLWLSGLGLVFGLLMYFGYLGISILLDQTQWTWFPEKQGVVPIILMLLNFLVNGFGEETAFRAYLQDRLINRHGLWPGIAVASVLFMVLHLLIYQITGIALAANILLAGLYGILYVWTGSIFPVGIMHAVFNLAPRLLNLWPSDMSLLIVNAVSLMVVAILFLRYKEPSRT